MPSFELEFFLEKEVRDNEVKGGFKTVARESKILKPWFLVTIETLLIARLL